MFSPCFGFDRGDISNPTDRYSLGGLFSALNSLSGNVFANQQNINRFLVFDILHQMITPFFAFREFYVTVKDNSGIIPELLCGQRDVFFLLAQKLCINYKSNRDTSSWRGFQAQYQVINESIIDGKGFPIH